MKKISIVVSVFNEEPALTDSYQEIRKAAESLNWDYEILFVNDGSSDGSLNLLRHFARSDSKVRVLSFSRNFGHEAAMIAGIDYADGDAVVCMDADLQHPPDLLPQIIQKFDEGYNVINMVRTRNDDAGLIKKITSYGFYHVFNKLSPVKFEPNASDFFAFDHKVMKVIRNEYRDRVRFLRGFIQMVGFRKTTIQYEAGKRVAGSSKYSIRKLLNFSMEIMFSFSDLPLKLGIYAGGITAVFGLVLMVYSVINKICFQVPAGYSTIIVFLCFMFAVMMALMGIIGNYISILFTEVKQRPIYIVDELVERQKTETDHSDHYRKEGEQGESNC